MELLTDPNAWIALLTLTLLEIVLGIDNIVFISILAGRLPEKDQAKGRQVGLLLAMGTRILLLLSIAWLANLTTPIFYIGEHGIAGRDIILMVGGMFLLWKSTSEIHHKLEGEETEVKEVDAKVSFGSVVFQIALLDIVFSLDSVITAVGMAESLIIMVAAVIIAIGIMLYASGPISHFVNDRPTVKILALSFLLLIGVSLFADGLHFHIPKGYIYFAMAFSMFVEIINLKVRATAKPVQLRQSYKKE
ncbi:MAG: hypothetical protein B6I38_03065 [Anaerolineaceae bacterium 4572_5.1]|nr:MAG: hypothetical protein B6I38_03065 [Anaerolineaceae bacterium 4572_5.1]